MLFNSIDFAIFLPIVFTIYWFVLKRHRQAQNAFLLVASYFFYGWANWWFLILICISSLGDYLIGLHLSKESAPQKRKKLLWLSLTINLGLLGYFKYSNFFIQSFADAISFFGQNIRPDQLSVILPVGISFYTFQTLSYTIDVYRNNIKAERNFISFFAFVSFFPQLVAGPIVRASDLLPQFSKNRSFDYDQAINGLRQILWGLIKKIIIADNCARFANIIFEGSGEYSGTSLVLGAIFFGFQIYGDFSGYSDIAIGTSKLFGFTLAKNFSYPYFSRDIAEFWRRWHISLTTWFRDYLYIPLGGSRVSTPLKIRNTFVIFVVSGFWHGANWTFVIWGALNALYFIPLQLTGRNRNHLQTVATNALFPKFKEWLSIIGTFGLVTFSWIFFRAENTEQAINYIISIFSPSLFEGLDFPNHLEALRFFLQFILVFIMIEWLNRHKDYPYHNLQHFIKYKWLRWTIYACSILAIYFFGNFDSTLEFIYFQF